MKKFYAHPSAAILIIVFICIAGIYEFLSLPIALYPQTSKPTVVVRLNTRGTSAEEFKVRFGADIESTLEGIQDVEQVIGRYRHGNVRIETIFKWSVDAEEAKDSVRSALAKFENQIPDYWSKFRIYFDGQHGSFFYASLQNSDGSEADLFELSKKILLPKIRKITGLDHAWARKRGDDTIIVTLLPDRLNQYNLTYNKVRNELKKHEYDLTLGSINVEGGEKFNISGQRAFENLLDLQNMIVTSINGLPIKLNDIAKVKIIKENDTRIFSTDGKKILNIGGSAKPEANLRAVSNEFFRVTEETIKQIDPRIKLVPLLNPSKFIDEAVRNIFISVCIGMLIATLIVLIFLKSLRSTLVICVSIPLSLIGGFVLMDMFNIEINLISLGAMALAVGMVVDGSIVVLENINRHFDIESPQSPQESLACIMNAVQEVKQPIFASILTTIIVFAPLPFTSALTSAVLGDLAIVMVCVLVVSIPVTLYFIPPLIMALSQKKPSISKKPILDKMNQWFDIGHNLYIQSLSYFLANKRPRIFGFASIAVLLGLGLWVLLAFVPRNIMDSPTSDLVLLHIDIDNEELSLEERWAIASSYEKKISKKFGPSIDKIITEGREQGRSMIWIFLKDKDKAEGIRSALEETFPDTPLLNFYAGSWAPTSLKLPNPADIKIQVVATNEDSRRDILMRLKELVESNEDLGRTDIRPRQHRDTFIKININRAKIIALNKNRSSSKSTSEDAIYQSISGVFRNDRLYSMTINDKSVPIRLKFPEAYSSSLKDIGNLLINFDKHVLPLRSLADISEKSEWEEFYSENSNPLAYLETWKKGDSTKDIESILIDLKAELAKESDIGANNIIFEDAKKEINDNLKSLLFALLLAVMLICVVITLQFSSLRQTFLIMLAIPLGFIGVAFSLWIFSSKLSVNSMLGLILLCGTAVNNSILFLDFYNRRREAGSHLSEAILETAKLRFRPIMITTLTTILGMLPIAIGWGSGGKILQPLGIAVCGGLWISTLLTLYVIPVGIQILDYDKTPTPNLK